MFASRFLQSDPFEINISRIFTTLFINSATRVFCKYSACIQNTGYYKFLRYLQNRLTYQSNLNKPRVVGCTNARRDTVRAINNRQVISRITYTPLEPNIFRHGKNQTQSDFRVRFGSHTEK